MITVSFTGHRPHKINKNIHTKLKDALKNEIILILEKYNHVTFLSGGALGVDQWAVEVLLKLRQQFKFTIKIIQPFPDQDLVWSSDQKKHFNFLKKEVDEVISLYNNPYASWKMMKRNEYLINNANILIAVYDDTVGGGTGHAVQKAKENKKKIILIDPKNFL